MDRAAVEEGLHQNAVVAGEEGGGRARAETWIPRQTAHTITEKSPVIQGPKMRPFEPNHRTDVAGVEEELKTRLEEGEADLQPEVEVVADDVVMLDPETRVK